MIFGYIRVSTEKQTVENQKFEIKNFCESRNLKVDRWVSETISSRVPLEKRKLGKLLKRLKNGDVLVASELSRLGRNIMEVMGILKHCLDNGCQIWTIKENYKLGADITSKVLAFAFSLSAEIERQLISQRTKECLARLKSEGKHLGRPFKKERKCPIDDDKEEILNMYADGVSKSEIARVFEVDRSTIRRCLKKWVKEEE